MALKKTFGGLQRCSVWFTGGTGERSCPSALCPAPTRLQRGCKHGCQSGERVVKAAASAWMRAKVCGSAAGVRHEVRAGWRVVRGLPDRVESAQTQQALHAAMSKRVRRHGEPRFLSKCRHVARPAHGTGGKAWK